MITIIIPSRTELYLNNTIRDVLKKATGEIELIVVLDGYTWPQLMKQERIEDPRVKYLTLPLPDDLARHKRQGINAAVSIANGEYLCWMDAHCVVAPGFDEQLVKDCQDNWVMVPSRYPIDIKSWDRRNWEHNRPPVDYVYWRWLIMQKGAFKQYRWDKRAEERKDIPIDDIMTCQASFVFMKKSWFKKMGFMETKGYMGWGQEGEELCLTTIYNGGRAVVDKNTWYAHIRKSQLPYLMYKMVSASKSYAYGFKHWVHEEREFFTKLIKR